VTIESPVRSSWAFVLRVLLLRILACKQEAASDCCSVWAPFYCFSSLLQNFLRVSDDQYIGSDASGVFTSSKEVPSRVFVASTPLRCHLIIELRSGHTVKLPKFHAAGYWFGISAGVSHLMDSDTSASCELLARVLQSHLQVVTCNIQYSCNLRLQGCILSTLYNWLA